MACRRCLQGDEIFATGAQLAHLLSNRPMEPSAMRGDSALRSSRLRLRCSSAVMNGPGSALGPRRAIGPLAGLGRVRMAPCVRRGCRAVGLASLVALWTGGSSAWASLADVLKEPQFNHLSLAPIAPALAATVASTYPVASASSGVVYVYNPALDTLERQTGVAGPILGERAETIGKGEFSLAASYSYVHLTSINGDDLDSLLNHPRADGKELIFLFPHGVKLADGRLATFLPVRVVADLDVQAHILAPSVTYGITNDLEVNARLPLLRTSLDVTAHTQVPDPRFPEFALPPGSPNAQVGSLSASGDAVGIGDLLLRAKWVPLRSEWVDVATQLGLSIPTGSRNNFQGTGTTRLQPTLIFSHVYGRFEPLVNVDIDLNTNDVSRSVVGWAAGGTAQVLNRLSVSAVFLGRHELAPLTEPLTTPFFFQIERNDQYAASVGCRWRFAASGVVTANGLVPLHDQGLRAAVIPTLELEYAF